MPRSLRVILPFLAVLCLHAQVTTTSRLEGFITDPAGKPVPGVRVTVTDTDKGTALTGESDTSGYYRFARLNPGAYRVEVAKTGFQTAARTGLVLAVNQAAALDVQLAVEPVLQTVDVQAEASPVQARSVEISSLVTERQVDFLPLNGRNFQRLLLLTPGAGGIDVFGEAPLNPSIAGSRPFHNNFLVDGIGANDERLTTGSAGVNSATTDLGPDVPNVISTEAIQEYRVIASNADATFGRGSGGQVNIVTKSGGNDLHGSAYWYVRNDAFDARNFFNTGPFFDARGRAVVPPFKQNVFGTTVGGPLVRNRHFFFANYEGFRQRRREQTLANAVIPNADLIRLVPGDLGRLYRALYLDTNIVPSQGNPAGTFSPLNAAERTAAVGAGFAAPLFDGDTANGEAGTVLVAAAPRRDVDQDAFLVRTDHVFSERFSLSARYNQAASAVEAQSADRALGSLGGDRLNFAALLQATWTLSPRQIVEARAGVLRNEFRQFPVGSAGDLGALGFPRDTGLNVTIGGAPFSTNINGQFVDHQTTPQISGQHTWVGGRWTLRSGADWRSIQLNVANFSAAVPNYTFAGFVGPNGILGPTPGVGQATALNASFTAFGQNGGPQSPMRGYRSHLQEYFAQADWRVRRDLTLNLGARYAYFGVYGEANDAVSNLYAVNSQGTVDPVVSPFANSRTANQVARIGDGRPFYQPDRNNVQPRVGAAWDLGGRGRTVVRAGYGLYYDRLIQIQFTGVVANPPLSASSNTANVPFRLGPPPVSQLTASPAIVGIDPEIRNPRTHRVNVALEQRLDSASTLTAAYVGALGRGTTALVELNGAGGVPNALRPDPRYTTQNLMRNFVDSDYHSLQLVYRRRFSRGLDVSAFYTYSRFYDDWSRDAFGAVSGLLNRGASEEAGFQGGGAQWAPRPKGADRGFSEYDVPHHFTLSHVWEVPFARTRWYGGWSVSGLLIWRSGEHMNLTLGRDVDDDGNVARDRPALLSGSLDDLFARGGRGRTQYLLPQAEANQRLGVPRDVTDPFAMLPRNPIVSPSVRTYDLSLLKRVGLGERAALSLEANAFNLSNRANFAPPSGTLSSPLFGIVTRTRTPSRQVQFGLKLSF